ncbi:FixH family protein [Oceanimonas sp. CHS3-5]|uniref:FixH family protein n=1 Tax=Oceanimonas sp. CHS3-5 TaxID=3068186 RepID=UPI00273FADD2|nr:FixH family protein [Oceanimonas sp. CHS3-5]MDP5291938.1 FixH family protein [Oceanimonas sp. CHS3-5]
MQRPWYKQFWPWFLITLPLCVVIASLYTLHLASTNADTMVVDDYYKKGRAINQDLSELKEAARLGLVAELSITNGLLSLEMQGEHKQGEAIYLLLSHPTLAEQDVQTLLTSDANGVYRFRPDHELLNGQWNLQLEAFDKRWRIQQRIRLPIADRLVIRAGS